MPWHWHNAIELFYIESGVLNYHTLNRTVIFTAGSAGIVNSNILHMTEIQTGSKKNVQLLHIYVVLNLDIVLARRTDIIELTGKTVKAVIKDSARSGDITMNRVFSDFFGNSRTVFTDCFGDGFVTQTII